MKTIASSCDTPRMSVAALPDLNVLPSAGVRCKSVSSVGAALPADCSSREREIEHLKLLLAKLQRMQFGRKSEKLAAADRAVGVAAGGTGIEAQRARAQTLRRQLRSPPLQTAYCSETHAPRAARSSAAANAQTRAERNGVSAMPGRVAQVGRGCFGDAGVRARQFLGDSPCAHQAELHEVRLHRAGAKRRAARSSAAWPGRDCWRMCWSRSTAIILPLYRQSEIYARQGCGTGALDLGRLGGRHEPVAGSRWSKRCAAT